MPDRPIFVLGCPRSGTTLLQLMLHAHPRIAIPPENRFVLPVYYARDTFGDLEDPANRRRVAEKITGKGTKFGDLKLDPAEITQRIVDGPPTIGSANGIVLRAYADRFRKPRWGDKRPAYYRHLPAILRMFPDALLVHLVRDPRACIASLRRMPWWPFDVPTGCVTWAQSVDCTAAATRTIPADSYHELRYEDLIADPETQLKNLCAFVGEEFHPAMTEPHAVAGEAVPSYKDWHTNTQAAVTSQATDKWRTELSGQEVGLIEKVLGGRMAAHGYEPSGAPDPGAALTRRYARISLKRKLSAAKRRALDLGRTVRERNPVADVTDPRAAGSGETPTSDQHHAG